MSPAYWTLWWFDDVSIWTVQIFRSWRLDHEVVLCFWILMLESFDCGGLEVTRKTTLIAGELFCYKVLKFTERTSLKLVLVSQLNLFCGWIVDLLLCLMNSLGFFCCYVIVVCLYTYSCLCYFLYLTGCRHHDAQSIVKSDIAATGQEEAKTKGRNLTGENKTKKTEKNGP